jgi:DNA-binding NarL/FixJ family response regulator
MSLLLGTMWNALRKDFANDEEAKKIGMRGYVSKAQAGATLLAAVDALLQNQTFFP